METPRWRIAIPSLVSATSLSFGLASIVLSSQGRFDGAAWLIVWCTILDKADGAVARALKAGSEFGVQMDSFADFAAFGIAPAALMYFVAGTGPDPVLSTWATVAAFSCPILAAIRLAKFNTTGKDDPAYFTGVPTTFQAGLFAATWLTLVDLDLKAHAPWVLPSAMLLLAVLMVSGLRIPKVKKTGSAVFNVALVASLAGGFVLVVLQALPEVLLGLGLVYLVGGSVAGWRHARAAAA